MEKSAYTLAGWLAIGAAVLALPMMFLSFMVDVLTRKGAEMVSVFLLLFAVVNVAHMTMYVYAFARLRHLLNERFGFHAVDTLIIAIIVLTIALVGVSILSRVGLAVGLIPESLVPLSLAVIVAFSLPLAVMGIVFAVKLLILQDRDSRCDGIQRQIADIPREIASEESAIKQLQEHLAAVEEEAKALEVRRLDLEGEVEQTEATIVKYKTQQMQVKKNEEYTALENEIGTLKQKISDLEDVELQILEEIDLKAAELANLREDTDNKQKTLEARIALLKQNLGSFNSELEDARSAVEDCRSEIDSGVLQQYTYVKSQIKRPPVVVELEDGRCKGCHLKVSGEVESEARKGNELVRCDSCGRILYFDR